LKKKSALLNYLYITFTLIQYRGNPVFILEWNVIVTLVYNAYFFMLLLSFSV